MATPSLIKRTLRLRREWFEKGFAGYPHFIIGICEGIVQMMHQRFGDGFRWAVGFCQNERFIWFWQVKDMVRLRQKFIRRTIRDFRYPDRLIKSWRPDWDKFLRLVDEVNRTDLTKLSDARLVRQYRKLYQAFNWQIALGQLTDSLLTAGGEDWFYEFLKARLPGVPETNLRSIFTLWSAPVYNSFSNAEHIDLLKIARQVRRQSALYRLFRHNTRKRIRAAISRYPRIKRAFKDHQKRYYWTENNYHIIHDFTIEHYIEKVRKLLIEHPSIDAQFRLEQIQTEKNKRAKIRLYKRYKIPPDIRAIVHLIEKFMIWHDTRKSGVLRNNHCLSLFLREISRRTKLPLKYLYYTYQAEVEDIVLRRRFQRALWRERMKRCVFIYTPTQHQLFQGNDIKGFTIEALIGRQTAVRELRGVPASPGRVQGLIRLINRQTDFPKLRLGEILVSNNTTPEFVPLMKKAAAIVTEQGGMTTHAAIVSREMKKPCVIGTKVATKVFKDGDRVEVDANKGIVRKI